MSRLNHNLEMQCTCIIQNYTISFYDDESEQMQLNCQSYFYFLRKTMSQIEITFKRCNISSEIAQFPFMMMKRLTNVAHLMILLLIINMSRSVFINSRKLIKEISLSNIKILSYVDLSSILRPNPAYCDEPWFVFFICSITGPKNWAMPAGRRRG